MKAPSPPRMLLVEDDPGDVELIRMGLEGSGITVETQVAQDRAEALAKLRKGPGPDLVLLDLNLPGFNGLEVLKAIRKDPQKGTLPVVVFTTSATAEDVRRCYEAGANAFVTKPLGLEPFTEAIKLIVRFYLVLCATPTRV